MIPTLPLSLLSRVGKQTEQALKKLGLETVHDLLLYFPFRYDDFSLKVMIGDLQPGFNVNIAGTVEIIQNKRSFKQRKNITEALISDDSGTVKVVWFNQPFIAKNLKAGDEVSLAGRVTESYGQTTLISPQYEKVSQGKNIHTEGLVPIYHLNFQISQKQLRFLIKQSLPALTKITEWLPQEVIDKFKFLPLNQAIEQIHFPQNKDKLESARLRLGFSELFLRQLRSQSLKYQLQNKRAHKIEFQELITKSLVASLPFTLSNDQRKTAWEILQDINKEQPMSRLLEGDVGSGKTMVAIMALLNVATNKKRGALMVPTEILAQQHYHNISQILSQFNVKIALLTGKQHEANFDLAKKKNDAREDIIKKAEIIIGTHALIQNYQIADLALVIVDEQHRFGVRQRQKLQQSGQNLIPHFLSMTATPIPRSLALAIYGDLDISLIKEMPKNRKTIITKIIAEEQRNSAYDFIKKEIAKGRQAFVICPLIDESDKLGVRSASAELKNLKNNIFPDLNIAMIHGRLKTEDKEKIMKEFTENSINILVATAVVEVGIDVPNASIMLIEGAERFGLSQLHQFRGRIGRDIHQSYCLLISSNTENTPQATQRLEALSKYSDGLSISSMDLKLRGSGDLYGLEQSGFPELKIASLFDHDLIVKAKEVASEIIKQSPTLDKYPLLKEKIDNYFEEEAHLE